MFCIYYVTKYDLYNTFIINIVLSLFKNWKCKIYAHGIYQGSYTNYFTFDSYWNTVVNNNSNLVIVQINLIMLPNQHFKYIQWISFSRPSVYIF